MAKLTKSERKEFNRLLEKIADDTQQATRKKKRRTRKKKGK